MAGKPSSDAVADDTARSDTTTPRVASLDQLLTQNKALFNELFDRQMAAAPPPIAPAALRKTQETTDPHQDDASDNAPGQMPGAPDAKTSQNLDHADRPADQSDIRADLNRRFTITWSSETLEQRIDNGRVFVSCRLIVGEDSSVESGSSRIREDGDEHAAVRRARDRALKKCADHFRAGPMPLMASEPSPGPGSPPERLQIRQTGPVDVMRVEQLNAALLNVRREMATVFSYACTNADGHGHPTEAVLVTDAQGQMISGQTGSFLAHLLTSLEDSFDAGDAMLIGDPYACGGAVSHLNEWLLLMPVFEGTEHVGFVAMLSPVTDAGGPTPGNAPADARSILGEGVRVAPVKIVKAGILDQSALTLILANSRTPERNRLDLMALINGCRAGASQLTRLRSRFGHAHYEQACVALRERSRQIMSELIVAKLPQEPQSFEDQIDDDGCGNGPFKLKVTVWREGEHAYVDWTGTCAQAEGPINLLLPIGNAKYLIARHLAGSLNPQLLANDGYYDLIHVTVPKGSLLNPSYPAPLGWRQDLLLRHTEMLARAMTQHAPAHMSAASFGTRPVFRYVGIDSKGRPFSFTETLPGGLGGHAGNDGAEGQALWPQPAPAPVEHVENNFPIVIEGCASIADTGGAGQFRGGNSLEKVYRILADGQISVHDDRQGSRPWGALGGQAGAPSERWLIRADDTRDALPAKCGDIAVAPGDRIVFRTAGAGGYGDPLKRKPEQVHQDIRRGLVTVDGAAEYGVVLGERGQSIDTRASEALRAAMKREPLT